MTDVTQFPNTTTATAAASTWIARLDGRALTPAEEQEFHAWIEADEQNRSEIIRLSALWDRIDNLAPLVNVSAIENDKASPSNTSDRFSGWRYAASFAALAAISAVLWLSFTADKRDLVAQNGAYATLIGERKSLMLPDGSTVLLNTDSRLEVAFRGDMREIRLLAGEAHFDVAHSRIPFVVSSRDSMVEAVGTEFSVHLRQSDVEVIVNEGRVRIAPEDCVDTDDLSAETAEMLTPPRFVDAGNAAVFSHDTTAFASLKMDNVDKALSWREGVLVFDDEPLADVIQEVSRYTPYQIVIADPDIRSRLVGGYFKAEQTMAILTSLEQGFGVRVDEVENGVFYISDNGR
ncbi:MAG: FecR domain-containing protein [Pseudomonadota bacterium]